MNDERELFQRTELLLGAQTMQRLARCRVILFGVGGVGSWCAESLIRSGIGHLTIVDGDVVCASNVNRQLIATTNTIGRAKVDVLRERLMEINPSAEIVTQQKIYTKETASGFHLDTYDYIIDAIDSLEHKCSLILEACRMPGAFFSSMGAALKVDAGAIRVAEFWQVKGCPLARALRHRFKRMKSFPDRKFKCVYSEELVADNATSGVEQSPVGQKRINGTLCHVTAIFGFTIAGLVIQDVRREPTKVLE
ncbi:MAG: tRNA threonylcarbamoyladenosine dehydratase [Bacteroidaceae bacterium]|nr:tRNA threonylcarbamoyladenosine dehydratase [Bacteroidaceae bacterium]